MIITPEEVGVLSRPISQHIDHAQISAYITEVESLQIRPNLGVSLLADIKANADKYSCLLNGSDSVSGGLRKAVAYYVYAKIIKQGATIATRFGAVEKTDEHSVRMEQEKKDNIFRECNNIADAYMAEVVKYAKARGWTQASKASAIRRTAFVIGDEPQAQECVSTTPTSGGGGGGTTEGGEIYAGEGINIRDNVISVDMAEVAQGVGVASLASRVSSVESDVEQLKQGGGDSSGGSEVVYAGEGLTKTDSTLSVDFTKVASVESVEGAISLAELANNTANTANSNANKASISASTAQVTADGAQATASTAQATALSAQSTANTAVGEANTAKAMAQEAQGAASQAMNALASKADKSDLDGYATTEDLASKADASALANYATTSYVDDAIADINTEMPIVDQSATTTTIQPNVLNVWGEVASLDITLADGEDGVVNEYLVQFTSGSTATTLTLPDDIAWMSAPNVQANKTYQISIINNLGVIGEFGNE